MCLLSESTYFSKVRRGTRHRAAAKSFFFLMFTVKYPFLPSMQFHLSGDPHFRSGQSVFPKIDAQSCNECGVFVSLTNVTPPP